VPVYNGAPYLRQAICSVLEQTHTNIEIIFIDDRSTDDSWHIINSFADKRIVAIRNDTNLGPEANFNKALMASSGRYIKLLGQDDLLAPDCIATQVLGLEDHPGAVLAFSKRRIIGPRDQRYFDRGPHFKSGVIHADRLVKTCLSKGTNLIGEPAAVLFRRSIVGLVGQFSAKYPYVIDLDYWVRLLRHGNAFYSDRPLACFRVSPNQWSVSIAGRQADDFVQFISTHSAFRKYQSNRLLMYVARLRVRANSLLRIAFYSLFIQRSSAT
jgi:glycosyltransferase involved in cell wall biosynthesis